MEPSRFTLPGRRSTLLSLVLFGLLATSSGFSEPRGGQTQTIGHNTLEYVYAQLAKRVAWASKSGAQFVPSPDTLPAAIRLCEKINPEAIDLSVAFGGFESWSYRYMQSYCFYEIATSAQSAELCDRVKEIDRPKPRRFLGREDHINREACRAEITPHGNGTGWAEFGTEMLLLLLGYTREEITGRANGRPPEYGGGYDFLWTVFPSGIDDEELQKRSADFMKRIERLPDFSKGDEAARRQLDTLAPGWASAENQSRLALALRCATERRAPGRGFSNECLGRMGP